MYPVVCVWLVALLVLISDKSQIFQLAHALRKGDKITAIVAPAYISQFGDDVTPAKFRTALQVLGFEDVHEVAFGADVGAISEAHHYAKEVATGKSSVPSDFLLPFLVHDGEEIFPDHDR